MIEMKKTIALVLMIVSFHSVAESIAWTKNEAGGHIVLTDEPCVFDGKNYKTARKAISYAPGRPEIEGCWGQYKRNENLIYIAWYGAEGRVMDPEDFTWK
jgi:hypothetical protein